MLAETYTREGFMQKQQMIWNLTLHIVWYVVIIFIANYKEMNRYLFSSTIVSNEDSGKVVYYEGFMLQNSSPRVTGGKFCKKSFP